MADVQNIAKRLEADTVSTAFSGVDAPGTAMNCLRFATQSRLGHEVRPGRIFHHIEWDAQCQEELNLMAAHQHPKVEDRPCLFGDISAFWAPDLKPVICQLQNNPAVATEVLAARVAAGTAVTRSAHCLQHGRQCHLKVADRHVAGTPCVAFSKRGQQLAAGDPSVLHALAWVALRVLLQEADVTQENVPAFPKELLSRFLLKFYWIDQFQADAVSFGVPQGRLRQYLRFRHRAKVLSEISPMADFAKRFWRVCSWAWNEFFFCRPGEYHTTVVKEEDETELRWAQARPSSQAQQRPLPAQSPNDPEAYLNALTLTELGYLSSYRSKWPGQVYQLNQNPCSGFGATSQPWALATLISNTGLLFFDGAGRGGRWLFASELLATQGFPVVPGVFNLPDAVNSFGLRNTPLCSFNLERPSRSVCHCGSQAHSVAGVQYSGTAYVSVLAL